MSKEDQRLILKPYINSNVMWSTEEEDKLLLYDPMTGNTCKITGVGIRIWKLCDGKRTIKDIIDVIYEEYDVQKETLISDTLEFIIALMQRNFISTSKSQKS